MNNALIRAFLESSLVNAQAHKAVEGCREPRPTYNGGRLAQDIKMLLKLMEIDSPRNIDFTNVDPEI